ncbi:MAG: FtsX-like permease family protein [Candidatus Aminicenantes bacterium]|nr:FtsX-like permease family protein [Candidatus Aminicenantes bacterium]
MKQNKFKLPRWFFSILRRFADEEILASIEEDLEVRCIRAKEKHSPAFAWFLCQLQGLSLLFSFSLESFLWGITMFRNYMKVAFRYIKRKKVYSFINILGLTIGMACFLLIGLWVKDELSFDRFHQKKDRIYRVLNKMPDDSTDFNITYAIGPALKAEYPEVEEACRVCTWYGSHVRYQDNVYVERNIYLSDPRFFQIFSFPFISGNPETALSDQYSLVITEQTAQKYFGEEDPLGKVLNLSQWDNDFTVTGVIEDIPTNSHLRFDMMGRIEFLGKERLARWEEWSGPNYVLLKPGVSPDDFEKKIAGIYKKNVGPETTYVPELQPLTQVHLYDPGRPGRVRKVTMFSVIALFILVMACINFMNLATAQSSRRALEVGMRKVIGAQRRQIIRQFLGEAVLIAFCALILALIAVEGTLPYFNQFTAKSLALLSKANIPMVLTLLLVTLGTGILAGMYPSLFLSSFQPAQTLRSQNSFKNKGGGIRRILIVVQFSISVGLIVSTLLVSQQLRYIQKKDIGLEREQIIGLYVYPSFIPRFETFKNSLLNQPEIKDVTSAAQPPFRVGENIQINWEGNQTDQMISADYTCVDYDFFQTFNMPIVQGRAFSKEYPTDVRTACVINETAARRMGITDPIDTNIYMNHPAWPESFRTVQVIGVVKDFHSRSLHTAIRPFVFRMYRPWHQYAFIKMDGSQIQKALAQIKKAYKVFSPGIPFDYMFLDEVFNQQYTSEHQLGELFNAFTFLSIAIACLGLFGLASYTVEQKTKEIGIRKVLGASSPRIVAMTTWEFLKWILIANAVAWPVAYFVMSRWLQDFAYKISISPLIFVLAAGLSLTVAVMTVSYHSIKIALSNPAGLLRYE